MLLPPPRVNEARALVVWALRAGAVALLTLGAYLALKRLLFAMGTGEYQTAFTSYMSTGEEMSIYRGLAMIAVGAALGAAAPRLARWMVQVPEETCPRCGYQAQGQAACPECGLVLRPPEPPGRGG